MFNIFLLINDRCTKLTNKMINLNWPITKKARYVDLHRKFISCTIKIAFLRNDIQQNRKKI